MSHRASVYRLWPALLSTVALSVAALVYSPSAVAKWDTNEPCVASNGLTLKQQYGYSVSIVTPDCNQLKAAERWAPSVPWIMNTRFEQVPSGFVTDWATPVDDFRGKLKKVEYLVVAGSPYQYNRSFAGDNKLWVGQLPDAAGLPAVNTSDLGSLDPLQLGQHVVDVYWELAAPHCDGFTTSQGTSCLPQGTTLVKRITFQVVAPTDAAQSR